MSNKTVSLTGDDVFNNILNAKGNFVSAVWKSNPKPASAHKGILLEKKSKAVIRAGINFANLSSVKEGIESGERGPVQELPWGEWKQFPYVIEHKDALYVRMYPSDVKTTTIYFANGEEVTKEKFATYLTPSDAKKLLEPEAKECFNVKRENILGIEDWEG